ncbi:hypothetical protein [Nonlabens xiamenensis]|uniref:hypothetical protein n=1 Tax=Nonlabens xiamenensis TaxID=2341043 RepID=UPI001F0C1A18|nr:hypothetical protein [Nonlabens xiamenensis]
MPMEVIIAGDIVDSQKNPPELYLEILKSILLKYSRTNMFQMYRGDSFQAWINKPEDALKAAIEIKAALKRNEGLDVRIAIGLGSINLIDNNIAVSTGTALTRSGALLDSLKSREQNLMVDADSPLDIYMNTALQMALLYMDEWTENSAATIHAVLDQPATTQEALGKLLGIRQATASRRLDRGYWKETQILLGLFVQYYKDVSHAHTS